MEVWRKSSRGLQTYSYKEKKRKRKVWSWRAAAWRPHYGSPVTRTGGRSRALTFALIDCEAGVSGANVTLSRGSAARSLLPSPPAPVGRRPCWLDVTQTQCWPVVGSRFLVPAPSKVPASSERCGGLVSPKSLTMGLSCSPARSCWADRHLQSPFERLLFRSTAIRVGHGESNKGLFVKLESIPRNTLKGKII